MELFHNLIFGFGVALSLQNLLYCFIGVLLGTLIGVLPGSDRWRRSRCAAAHLQPCAGRGVDHARGHLLRLDVRRLDYLHPHQRSWRSRLGRDLIDGYQMAKKGRAGPALGIAAIGSFVAGTVGTLILPLFGPPLADRGAEFRLPRNTSR